MFSVQGYSNLNGCLSTQNCPRCAHRHHGFVGDLSSAKSPYIMKDIDCVREGGGI